MENNNDNKSELTVIGADPEVLPAEPYDFDFIANTLGLIPYRALAIDDGSDLIDFQGAFNPGAIINLEITETGGAAISLHGGEEIEMGAEHLADLEEALRQKIEDNKAKQKEAIKDNMRMQAEAVNELQNGVQGAGGVIVGKRGRFAH